MSDAEEAKQAKQRSEQRQAGSSGGGARPDKVLVKMEGYLEKRGKMRVVSMWKRYWFVLEGRLLLYYKSQQEYVRLSPCRGSLNMGLASGVYPAPGHALDVMLRSHVVSLRAKDRLIQEQWLKALLDSMASFSTSPGKENTKGPLHFRYLSADNISKQEQSPSEDEEVKSSSRKEKHRTLPDWKRTPSTGSPLLTVHEKTPALNETPAGTQDKMSEDLRIAPRKTQGKLNKANLTRQGSILPILGNNGKSSSHNSPRAIHPGDAQEVSSFGSQRYSFHGFPKTGESDINSTMDPAASVEGKGSQKDLSGKKKSRKNFESVLKKQLSFSSPSSHKKPVNQRDFKFPTTLEEVLQTPQGKEIGSCLSPSNSCKKHRSAANEKCHCHNTSTPVHDENKENLSEKWPSMSYGKNGELHNADENQNRLFSDSPKDIKKRNCPNVLRNQSGSECDLLATSGVDLSFLSPSRHSFQKPVRCTSADELWSPPRKNLNETCIKYSKCDHMGIQYFSANDVCHPSHTLNSCSSEPIGSERRKLTKLSNHQKLIHGDGEYIKYSVPEDCDKRDSTLNTTTESHLHVHEINSKHKIRLKKRKGSSAKDGYSFAGNSENGPKKRLSFLSRVLSHVRRTKSEDIMDHPESNGMYSDDAFLSPHPDMNPKCASTTPLSQVILEVKRMDSSTQGSHPSRRADFQLGSSSAEFGEAPEEPPPDYDSVGVDPIMDSAEAPGAGVDQPPQLPPRRMKRPRSPWHDVPTNNSPVIDMDGEARHRMLSAAKYGKVVGTRASHVDLFDWSDSHPGEDHSQHHAYEVVSDDTSTAGSNEHLAIYLSSESSDDEFHEEVVLRRNIEDCEFLYGRDTGFRGSTTMEPLTISTDQLPALDSSGRVGLSHVEAMKLSLLMKAQQSCANSIRRQKEEKKTQDIFNQDCSRNFEVKAKIKEETSNPLLEECLQQPPEEFADNENLSFNSMIESTEKVMAEVTGILGILSPVESLLRNTSGNYQSEKNSNHDISCELELKEISSASPENSEIRPELPLKKRKNAWKIDGDGSCNRDSKELNNLLFQLASMTTAPLLPVGASCSLQMSASGSDCSAPVRSCRQSHSLEAVGNKFDLEPDYDIPRPHASLLHILPRNGRQCLSQQQDDDGIIVGATHFFSRPESPRNGPANDSGWNGHMSPDSLDFPFVLRRGLSWEVNNTAYSDPPQDKRGVSTKNSRRKDRNRRATLNGPVSLMPQELTPLQLKAPLVRRSSIELNLNEIENDFCREVKNQKERGMSGPKHVKIPLSCEHDSSQNQPVEQVPLSPKINLLKNFNVAMSLEDISERSELNSDSSFKPDVDHLKIRLLERLDDVDADSLEASELRKISVSETIASITISPVLEEPLIVLEKSESLRGTSDEQCSFSASDGALMINADSSSSAVDQQATLTTDSDLEFLSDDDCAHTKDDNVDCNTRIIEPDSLVPESFAAEKTDLSEEIETVIDSESTKEISFETDSLELKNGFHKMG